VEGGWQLVGETAPGNTVLLATLKSKVEIQALRQFCEYFLQDPHQIPEHFLVESGGKRYTVTPLGGAGEKLTLLVAGEGGEAARVATEFVLAPKQNVHHGGNLGIRTPVQA
jgi:hypothetical protein